MLELPIAVLEVLEAEDIGPLRPLLLALACCACIDYWIYLKSVLCVITIFIHAYK